MSKAIRKPTLDEWFLIYQLKKIKKQFHLPVFVDVDVTRLAEHYKKIGVPAPYTTILIKAAGLWAEMCPEINKAVFHTFYGPRVVDFPYISVNVPITMMREGKKIVSATAIKDAHKLSYLEIRKEIKKTTKKPLNELPINRILHKRKNNFFSRLQLKLIHFTMMNLPSIYVKNYAGGITVSSIPHKQSSLSPLQGVTYGITGATLFNCSTIHEENKTKLRVGIGYDHMICYGDVAMEASTKFCHILEAQDERVFNELIR